jgi:hypothetical protein
MINYNCSICHRISKKVPIHPIMVFDLFDNDEFLNNIAVNQELLVFVRIYNISIKIFSLFLMGLVSLPIILCICHIFS